ncbi:GDSL-type esterase/lipase family protein [Phormidium sp. CCY1219]|uniref:GDSL-type esterase/lipase family protein n=1 Tax=Phormidium sp. CCY1219 TaxID=2886104 RepID=UPI002D1F466D|nr:GDSL-type esterase/lipase family protein [Phormidium sp. CCY1219]MEB3831788.1 GDSL-type esterase/lipase family protein [Phormidium sp. CCY1219]
MRIFKHSNGKYFASLTLNVLFAIAGIIFIAHKGGIPYLMQKLNLASDPNSAANSRENYYRHRTSLFKLLPNSPNQIVFLGDSLTDSAEWRELLGNPHIINRGIYGDTTTSLLNRIEVVVEGKPRQIFLLIGINDIHREIPLKFIVENYQQILATIREKSPETDVVVQSVLPINNQEFTRTMSNETVRELNGQIKALAEQFSYRYIDLFSKFADHRQQLNPKYTEDGVHLNGEGYLNWKEQIVPYLQE